MIGYFFFGFVLLILIGISLGMSAKSNDDCSDAALIQVAFKWMMANCLVVGGIIGLVATVVMGVI